MRPPWVYDCSDIHAGDPTVSDELCVSVTRREEWRIDRSRGSVDVESTEDATEELGALRPLGHGLYDMSDRSVARIVDEEQLWRRTPSDMFSGANVSPDYGWSWQESDNLLVGWFGTVVPLETFTTDGVHEIAPAHLAGIDAQTGQTVWTAPGDPNCFGLFPDTHSNPEAEQWVRCVTSGTRTVQNEQTVDAAATITVEGFVPATGQSTWTVTLPAASARILTHDYPIVQLDDSVVVVPDDDGHMALDLTNGELTELEPDAVGWCSQFSEYDYTEDGEQAAERSGGTRPGADFVYPCSPTGTAIDLPQNLIDGVGVTVGEVFVWYDADGIHAVCRTQGGC